MGSKVWNPPPQDEAPSSVGIVPPPQKRHSAGQVRVACLVTHLDRQGNVLPGCLRCQHCGGWIRPEDMGSECGGKGVPGGEERAE